MVLSEDKDYSNLKRGVIAVVVLLVLGSLAPVLIEESIGVKLDTLCEKGEVPVPPAETCLDTDTDISADILKALGYIPIVVAIVALVGFTIVGVRY